jgi:hypothetical protein
MAPPLEAINDQCIDQLFPVANGNSLHYSVRQQRIEEKQDRSISMTV